VKKKKTSRNKRRHISRSPVKADPAQWSRQSRQSYSFYSVKEYVDIKYFCWRCGKADIFSAEDQRASYEVKKNYVWQQRVLCQSCWHESNGIRAELQRFQKKWADSKNSLRKDNVFLVQWFNLLKRLEEYVPYKPDTAKKNMLAKLIKQNIQG
jgi:hypothetical protein